MEKTHAMLPRRLPVWQDAVMAVDLTRPCPDDAHRLGLWLPEAEFVMTVQQTRRLFVYMGNWLRHRCAILSTLDGPARYAPPRPGWWRTLLARFPKSPNDRDGDKPGEKKRRKEKDEACDFFTELLGEPISVYAPIPNAFVWRGVTVSETLLETGQLEDYLPRLQEIGWELAEVGFRVELFELDRFHVPERLQNSDAFEQRRRELLAEVFGDGHHLFPSLPPANGLFSMPDIHRRAACLDALRRLLCHWPSHPSHFDTLVLRADEPSAHTLETFEHEAARFYCQQFYEWAGRAPSLPREPPS